MHEAQTGAHLVGQRPGEVLEVRVLEEHGRQQLDPVADADDDHGAHLLRDVPEAVRRNRLEHHLWAVRGPNSKTGLQEVLAMKVIDSCLDWRLPCYGAVHKICRECALNLETRLEARVRISTQCAAGLVSGVWWDHTLMWSLSSVARWWA